MRVMAGLMLSLFVAAMDSTVVGTALPTIAKELGSFQLYAWIVAGYLITATTTVPIWGRLADIRGRRPVLLAGLLIFIVASALCAASPGMGWLIAFRTLQGIGAGCGASGSPGATGGAATDAMMTSSRTTRPATADTASNPRSP